MADTKISAMTPAANFSVADIFPIVQGGVNFSASKAQVLTAGVGENLDLAGSTGNQVNLTVPTGNSVFSMDDAGVMTLGCNNTFSIQTPSVGFGLVAGLTGTLTMRSGIGANSFFLQAGAGPSVTFDPITGVITFAAVGGMFCPYVAAVVGNWAIPVPLDLATAIDRLVAAVVARTIGGPV